MHRAVIALGVVALAMALGSDIGPDLPGSTGSMVTNGDEPALDDSARDEAEPSQAKATGVFLADTFGGCADTVIAQMTELFLAEVAGGSQLANACVGAAPLRPQEGEVVRLYRAILGRQPDRSGFEYWTAMRVEGVPLDVVAESFLVGREFNLRFQADDDGAFLRLVYGNVLGRVGDPDGVAYWQRALAGGLPRTDLIILFSESAELQLLTATVPRELPAYSSATGPVTATDLARSWRPGCPVGPSDLRALTVDHLGYDGAVHRGTLIVHRSVVHDVDRVFARLYQARFPIAAIRPIHEFGADDDASMAADNTSAFNCRAVTGGRGWSRHAFGTAIDINPVENPYVTSTVLPPAGAELADRSRYHPGMVRPGDIVTMAFAEIGWRWGADFTTVADYQHFER